MVFGSIGASSVAATTAATLYVGLGGGLGNCAAPAFVDIPTAIEVANAGDTIHIEAAGGQLTFRKA